MPSILKTIGALIVGISALVYGFIENRERIPCPLWGTECEVVQHPGGDVVLQREGDVDTVRLGQDHNNFVPELETMWNTSPEPKQQPIPENEPFGGLSESRWGELTLLFDGDDLAGWELAAIPGEQNGPSRTPDDVHIEGDLVIGMTARAFIEVVLDVTPQQLGDTEYALCEEPRDGDDHRLCVAFRPAWIGGALPEQSKIYRFWAVRACGVCGPQAGD